LARVKIAYVGGGSSRAPGTMASLIAQGENFQGSEIVLIDLDEERLALVKTLAEKMARCQSLDLIISTTTDRRAGLTDCDAVLSSYRPGGFEARVRD
jgi:6-phospho-beta-glucosidase